VDDQERPRTTRFRNAPLAAVGVTPHRSVRSRVHLRSGARGALSPDALRSHDGLSSPWRLRLKGCAAMQGAVVVPRPVKDGAPLPTWRARRPAKQPHSVDVMTGGRLCCNRAQAARITTKWRVRPSKNAPFSAVLATFSTIFSVFFHDLALEERHKLQSGSTGRSTTSRRVRRPWT
jgi:hypothetical protein